MVPRSSCGPQARRVLQRATLPSSSSMSRLATTTSPSSMSRLATTALLQWHMLYPSGSKMLNPVRSASPVRLIGANSASLPVWPARLLHFRRDTKLNGSHGNINQAVENLSCLPGGNIYGYSIYGSTRTRFHVCRSSTLTEKSLVSQANEEFITFLKSATQELEGSNHCWFNMSKANMQVFNKSGAFLVLGGVFVQNSKQGNRRSQMLLLERAKILKRRYPKLQIFGFQHSSSVSSVSSQSCIIKIIMEDYVTFPILLTDREFPEIMNKTCWLLFDGAKDSFLCFDSDIEAKVIAEDIERLLSFHNSSHKEMKEMEKLDLEVAKGNHYSSFLKNLLLCCPGGISADESGKRLFISDTNHHRIIVSDEDGKILEYIGSAPGFEDGGFETAELLRPAGLFYDDTADCLYFADSENHAIRRADLGRRVVETVYPAYGNRPKGLWNWILDKLGVKSEKQTEPVVFDIDSFAFPWHVMNYGPDELTIFDRSFESSWVLSTKTWKIKSNSKGLSNILEAYQERINEKLEPLEEVLKNPNLQRVYGESSLEMDPNTHLMSSTFKTSNGSLFCDAASQMVFRCENTWGNVSCIRFSDFEVLGYPYWFSCPIEPFTLSDAHRQCMTDCKQHFKILPGRCEIVANVGVPDGFELAAPLGEECILRQVRGSATVASRSELSESSQVGVAQQWYDELDNLVYSRPGTVVDALGEEAPSTSAKHQADSSLFIESAIDTSPGKSEIVISAVLYLRLKDTGVAVFGEEKKKNFASKLSCLYEMPNSDPSLNLLLESAQDLSYLTFTRSVHLRVTLECADHPLDPISRETINTDSRLEFNVSL